MKPKKNNIIAKTNTAKNLDFLENLLMKYSMAANVKNLNDFTFLLDESGKLTAGIEVKNLFSNKLEVFLFTPEDVKIFNYVKNHIEEEINYEKI